MNDTRKSAMTKLKNLGLTDDEIFEMLGENSFGKMDAENIVSSDNTEEIIDQLPSKWEGDFLLEQLEYYNKSIGGKDKGARLNTVTPIKTLEEFIDKIQSGEIEVHFDWESLHITN